VWLVTDIIYGLFLAEMTVLTPVETELVVLVAVLSSGLKETTAWHLR
jgi:hypothetical protein